LARNGRITKTKAKAQAIIQIPPGLVVRLRARRAEAKLADDASEWVFPSSMDSVFHTGNVDRTLRRFQKQLEREKLPALRIYDCRHTYATLALQSRASIVWLSNQLGHNKTSITSDVSAHALPASRATSGSPTSDGTRRHQPFGSHHTKGQAKSRNPRVTNRLPG